MGIVANTFADSRRIYLLSVSGNKTAFDQIPPFDEHGLINVIIDTPRGSQNKYAFNHERGLFKLSGLLTAGHTFPFDLDRKSVV